MLIGAGAARLEPCSENRWHGDHPPLHRGFAESRIARDEQTKGEEANEVKPTPQPPPSTGGGDEHSYPRVVTNATTANTDAKTFYEKGYKADYAQAHAQGGLKELEDFVARYNLKDTAKCLEVGCGRGNFQDLVVDYTGMDLAQAAGAFMHKPFVAASATRMPFADSTFDALWSIYVLEHVPEPEKALSEIRRVLKPGGLAFLLPAWQCRPWAADGYTVRPYSDFGLGGKVYKAMIPVRESVLFRSSYIFPRRVLRRAAIALRGPMKFRCGKLKPNYEQYWISDGDAVNAMDPYELILWFRSRGDEVLHPSGGKRQFFIRSGEVVLRVRK